MGDPELKLFRSPLESFTSRGDSLLQIGDIACRDRFGIPVSVDRASREDTSFIVGTELNDAIKVWLQGQFSGSDARFGIGLWYRHLLGSGGATR